jgi:hypothetical protein
MTSSLVLLTCDQRATGSSMDSHYYQNVDAILSELYTKCLTPVHSNVAPALVLVRPKAIRPQQLVQREQVERDALHNISHSPLFVDRNEGARHPEPLEDEDGFNGETTYVSLGTMVDLFQRTQYEENMFSYPQQRPFPVQMNEAALPRLIKPIASRAVDAARFLLKEENNVNTVHTTPMQVCG